MNLRLMIEELQGQAQELMDNVDVITHEAMEHKEDVVFLYKKIVEALPHCNPEAYRILFEVGLFEFKAVEEEKRKEGQNAKKL